MSAITLNIQDLRDDQTALYYRYDSQTNPQPAYVRMDEDGEVDTYVSGEIGNGVPSNVWHGRTLTWNIPCSVDCNALADTLESEEVMALLQRIHAGHDVSWNGSNFVGTLNDDAQDASHDLERILEQADTVDILDTEGLLGQISFSDAWPEGMGIDEAARAHIEAAESEGGVVVATKSDIKEAILRWANGRDDLSDQQLADMVANEKMTQAEADEARAERDAE